MNKNNKIEVEKPYQLIDKQADFDVFITMHQSVKWFTFDTEFIGEKRYETLLCLIQVMSEFGCFIIDPISITDLSPFNELLCNPAIQKITHAGYNDLKIFYLKYKKIPQNIFDTQIAAGFVGYKYPISFQNLVEGELNITLKKAYTITNWDQRPIENNQLKYGYEDVFYLKGIWESIHRKLEESDRMQWAIEECAAFCDPKMYETEIAEDFYGFKGLSELSNENQLMLYRILVWRDDEARRKNHSREMILSSKIIFPIASNFHLGKKMVKYNRHIPEHILDKNWDAFQNLAKSEITESEQIILENIPKPQRALEPKINILSSLLKSYVEWMCLSNNVAIELLSKNKTFRNLTINSTDDENIVSGWRKEVLGDEIFELFKNVKNLTVETIHNGFQVKSKA